jgi:anhydro-N-acetylmuramic acid kinase
VNVWPGTARPESDVLVGLMSGTSCDGISAAVVRFHEGKGGHLAPEVLAFIQTEYDAEFRTRLIAAMTAAKPAEYTRLDFELGERLANAARVAISEAGVPHSDIAAIASHGHTVWHEPPHATWQFGQPAVIAERIGLPVISDFRVRDVAAGGQGAPLVPIADALLFSAEGHWRALQNIGGIGNVTVLPPGEHGVDLAAVRAFDTGPGVCIIDGVTRLLRPELAFDRDGELALRGVPIPSVVESSLNVPYFKKDPPKSTGRELFTTRYIEDFVARCRAAKANCSDADIVATAVDFTARSIALAFDRFVPEPVAEVLLSGGGARNPALFDAIEKHVLEIKAPAPAKGFRRRAIRRFDDVLFDGDAKEAVAFALLGWLHLKGRAGNVRTATGARGARVLGNYTPA